MGRPTPSASTIWARTIVRDQLAAELREHKRSGLQLIPTLSPGPNEDTAKPTLVKSIKYGGDALHLPGEAAAAAAAAVEEKPAVAVAVEKKTAIDGAAAAAGGTVAAAGTAAAGEGVKLADIAVDVALVSALWFGVEVVKAVLGDDEPAPAPAEPEVKAPDAPATADPATVAPTTAPPLTSTSWITPDTLPPIPDSFKYTVPPSPISLGIVGGGICGLYIAFILDALAIPDVSYEILEANPSRLGGRCYTHHFTERPADPHEVCQEHGRCKAHRVCSDETHGRCVAHKGCIPHDDCDSERECKRAEACGEHDDPEKATAGAASCCKAALPCRAHGSCLPQKPCEEIRGHDYYDVGAMRFPDNHMMDRFFEHCRATSTLTVPFYQSAGSVNVPIRYNNVCQMKGKVPWETNPFNVETQGALPKEDPGDLIQAAMEPYLTMMRDAKSLRAKETALKVLMSQDDLSTREHLKTRRPYYTPEIIEYLEAFAGTTDLFSVGFPEGVFQTIDFNTQHWRCIEGGTQLLAENTAEMLSSPPVMGKTVTRIALTNYPTVPRPMAVSVVGEPTPRDYSAVFLTTTLSCMQRMDLDDAALNWGHRTAIRSLHLTPATKVAIKFARAWWIELGITSGGIGTTDEPLRNCVYPSYNIHDPPGQPAVLLCSYAWTEDAHRLGSLLSRDTPNGEDELKELLLRGLARLHEGKITYERLQQLYLTHHSYDWYRDPLAAGACTGFRPGQFTTLYPLLTRPAAEGLLFIAGEAFSSNHGWIVSALESGWRAVDQFLIRFNLDRHRSRLRALFGEVPEVEGGPGSAESEREKRERREAKGPGVAAPCRDIERLQVLLGSLPSAVQKVVEVRPDAHIVQPRPSQAAGAVAVPTPALGVLAA